MQAGRAALAAGERARRRYGEPPTAVDDLIDWCWRRLGIDVLWCDALPTGAEGFSYSIPGRGVRGRVLLSPAAERPRAVIAHEVGHLMMDNGAAFSLCVDHWQMQGPEREARAFAAALLLPADELAEMLARGHTEQQIADRYGVAPGLVRLRVAHLWEEPVYVPDP